MVLKCALNNICNTVMSGQGPSSSAGSLKSVRKKPGREEEVRKRHMFDFPVQTSVWSYFEEEKQTGKSLLKNRPLAATGISKATIK